MNWNAAIEYCDLCIVGAGYSGLNALDAAGAHLPEGARVIIVDKGARWGGHWAEQYSFVRLHTGHWVYTAGAREWSKNAG